jgi:PAS domain S-box-containing protein
MAAVRCGLPETVSAGIRSNLQNEAMRDTEELGYAFPSTMFDVRDDRSSEAQALLTELSRSIAVESRPFPRSGPDSSDVSGSTPDLEARYRALVEQIPAVVFIADLDQCIGQAYISPHIEVTLGFSREEWLDDPIRWYQQIHPDDKERWALEAAEVFLTGKAVRSCYRVLARDGHVVWFQCEAKVMLHPDHRPWFIHGIAFDITDLKRAEEALQEERNVASAILDSIGTLVVVLDPRMRVVRFNRVCEETTGYSFSDVRSRFIWDLMPAPEQADRFRSALKEVEDGRPVQDFEVAWESRGGEQRLISWSLTALRGANGAPQYFIAAGTDVTVRKRLETAVMEVSGREQRRIGQDLHDGLGQLLTGIAFMSKVQEQRLVENGAAEAGEASKIVRLVNEAIHKARELSRGLMPGLAEPNGLMSSLEQMAHEMEEVFGVACRFYSEEPLPIHDPAVASHLYHIAQEAVSNAIKHGKSKHIEIDLHSGAWGVLAIRDDGCGIAPGPRDRPGMGLDIMRHRAKMIGGALAIVSDPEGTIVTCRFPLAGEP